MYGGQPTGRPLPATSTTIVTSDTWLNIMSENASSSEERPVYRDHETVGTQSGTCQLTIN